MHTYIDVVLFYIYVDVIIMVSKCRKKNGYGAQEKRAQVSIW